MPVPQTLAKTFNKKGQAEGSPRPCMARWSQVGGVPYQVLPLLQFFTYKIYTCEKMRKGVGEPGDKAISM